MKFPSAQGAPDKVQTAPLLPGYYCNLAEVLFHQGKRDEARKCVEKALYLARCAVDCISTKFRFPRVVQTNERKAIGRARATFQERH